MMIPKKERRLNVETTQKKVSSCIKYNMENNKKWCQFGVTENKNRIFMRLF